MSLFFPLAYNPFESLPFFHDIKIISQEEGDDFYQFPEPSVKNKTFLQFRAKFDPKIIFNFFFVIETELFTDGNKIIH